jgi:two-component system sensor kinase FixL
MGIGLSISRSIIEAHDGKMWAKSKPGGGAVFSFVLPLVNAEHEV